MCVCVSSCCFTLGRGGYRDGRSAVALASVFSGVVVTVSVCDCFRFLRGHFLVSLCISRVILPLLSAGICLRLCFACLFRHAACFLSLCAHSASPHGCSASIFLLVLRLCGQFASRHARLLSLCAHSVSLFALLLVCVPFAVVRSTLPQEITPRHFIHGLWSRSPLPRGPLDPCPASPLSNPSRTRL